MPHIRSAKKRNRQNIVRRTRNKAVLTHFRNAVKNVIAAVDAGDGAPEAVRKAQSALDRAATKNVIHRKTASRRAGRLARRAHKAAVSN